tara:strand:+ start:84 stop:449 length:366 start_codon:yes stop_codon:yes gene_type:complete
MSIFSSIGENKKLYISKHFFIIKDEFPVSDGHLLIISKELRVDYFDLNADEKAELPKLIDVAKELIEKEFHPEGYNIGINCGKQAGQTVMHFHCHLIPRYKGDVDDPTGGVRNIIPGKGKY